MTAPVFLADGLSSVVPGAAFRLGGAEGRHSAVVQRKRRGERVDVVDGAGTRLICTVAVVEGAELVLNVGDVVAEAAPATRLVLVQALAKGDRDEQAIEAAIECGVDAVIPWQAERSIVVWRGERAAKSHAKWEATALAAMKQSRRAFLPPVENACSTKALAERVRAVVAEGGTALVLHEEATEPVISEGSTSCTEILVIVGPEGGISETELAALTEAGARPTRLGPHVMRTSTAGPVAVALLSERLGRWNRPGPVPSNHD